MCARPASLVFLHERLYPTLFLEELHQLQETLLACLVSTSLTIIVLLHEDVLAADFLDVLENLQVSSFAREMGACQPVLLFLHQDLLPTLLLEELHHLHVPLRARDMRASPLIVIHRPHVGSCHHELRQASLHPQHGSDVQRRPAVAQERIDIAPCCLEEGNQLALPSEDRHDDRRIAVGVLVGDPHAVHLTQLSAQISSF
mmetsp:Transcript_22322/g.73376  ORF Transcript_22322/g.73376 Transcript_22322/m.73376 type:complete len:201 (-) Transcript_22322:2320-2922(-)